MQDPELNRVHSVGTVPVLYGKVHLDMTHTNVSS